VTISLAEVELLCNKGKEAKHHASKFFLDFIKMLHHQNQYAYVLCSLEWWWHY